jgi:hypothetical protein
MADKYAIRVILENGSSGWIAGRDCKILLFKTKPEAIKALKEMKKDSHYSWKYETEVAECTASKG